MNWNIGLIIWLKGVGIFGVLCLLAAGTGIIAFIIAIMFSWVAVPVYAMMMWFLKSLKLTYKQAMSIMLLFGPVTSVLTAWWLFRLTNKDLFTGYINIHTTFWIPLICSVLSVIYSCNRIHNYLYPEAGVEKFATE